MSFSDTADGAPLFPIGKVVSTPNACRVLEAYGIAVLTLLLRHVHGDWGDLGPSDARANQEALHGGARLLSSYQIAEGVRVWIITEADRSTTTVLMPEDY
ncbi:hypothetical protein [Thiorhodococcus fuscus]|uniref:Type I restriction endonuclease subunit M n=1 Tax=Thiorhodococcus fuscus TaxID=527200 RepID=A0ABW4Y948_9GAMM